MPRNLICAVLLALGISSLLQAPLDPSVPVALAVDTHAVSQEVHALSVAAAATSETAPATGKQQTTAQPAQESPEKVSSLPRTLPPDLFTGSVKEGYQIAQAIPEVLVELRCYCGCDRSIGHRNLLDCFVDDHAAG